jgi:hypothetical protein
VRDGWRRRVELFHVEVRRDCRGVVKKGRVKPRAEGARRARVRTLAVNIAGQVLVDEKIRGLFVVVRGGRSGKILRLEFGT